MSSQRLILALAMLATLVAIAHCKSETLGHRQAGDKLVHTKTVFKPAVSGRGAVDQDTFAPVDGKKITAVEVVDRNGNQDATYAKFIGGGEGHAYATVGFYSKPSFGIDYVVYYYAK